jgi:hypothetical protein
VGIIDYSQRIRLRQPNAHISLEETSHASV